MMRGGILIYAGEQLSSDSPSFKKVRHQGWNPIAGFILVLVVIWKKKRKEAALSFSSRVVHASKFYSNSWFMLVWQKQDKLKDMLWWDYISGDTNEVSDHPYLWYQGHHFTVSLTALLRALCKSFEPLSFLYFFLPTQTFLYFFLLKYCWAIALMTFWGSFNLLLFHSCYLAQTYESLKHKPGT